MAEPAPQKTPHEDLIRSLANLLNETGLTEIEIEENTLRVRVARTLSMPAYTVPYGPVAAPAAGIAGPGASGASSSLEPSGRGDVAHGGNGLPFAGTGRPAICRGWERGPRRPDPAHHRSDEDHEPDRGTAGGIVKRIIVENGQPVEYGEPLMIIE